MQRLACLVLFTFALWSCSKTTDPGPAAKAPPAAPAPAPGSGSAAGSAASPSGSGSGDAAAVGTAAGSGSAAAAGSAAGSGSAAAGSGSAEESGGSGFDFDKLTHDEKMKFMKNKVVPAMKDKFQTFDKTKYADFGCKTCHGKNPQAKKYKMPNPDLPKLDFAALKAGKQKPEVAKFMSDAVKPTMAKLLEQPEMSKDHPDGFGCLECHEQKK